MINPIGTDQDQTVSHPTIAILKYVGNGAVI